jgi:hypothetical protein
VSEEAKIILGAYTAFVVLFVFLGFMVRNDNRVRDEKAQRKATACVTIAQEIDSKEAALALAVVCE